MRFIDAIAEYKAATRKPVASPAVIQIVTQDEFAGRPPIVKAVDLAKLYESNPWARAIVDKIADRVARQKWFIETPDGTRIDKHPVLDFLRAGCPGMTGRRAIRVTQTLIELQGECFWIVGRNLQGLPVAYAPIPAHWAIDTPGKTFKGYRIQPRSGVAFELSAADVIHFKVANPLDPYGRGTSVAQAARVELESDAAAANYLASFFANRCRPDIVITGDTGAPLDEKGVARLEETWSQKLRGSMRAGRPFFSRNKLNIQEIGAGLKDNAAPELRELNKKNIAEIWSVPPEVLGRLDNSNRATIDAAEYLFARNCIDPRLAALQDAISDFCDATFKAVDGTDVQNFPPLAGNALVYESPISEDLEFALKCVTARPSAFTDNEVRAFARLKPAEGKDEFPPDAREVADMTAEANANDGGDDKPPTKPGKKKPKKSETIDASYTVDEAKSLNLDDVVSVSNSLNDPSVTAEVTRLFNDVLAASISKFGSELLETLAVEADFQVFGNVAEFIAREVPDLIGLIDNTTRKELLSSLAEGASRSEAVDELVLRVERIFEEAAKVRSSLIGDTVATKIAGFASQEAATQGGFDKKKWLSTRDNVVRSTHAALNGQIRTRSDKFQSPSGAQALHPGAFGVASEDANCRCAMRPVLEGEKDVPLEDSEFAAVYETRRAAMAKRIGQTARKVFAGQAAVVLAELKRLGSLRR